MRTHLRSVGEMIGTRSRLRFLCGTLALFVLREGARDAAAQGLDPPVSYRAWTQQHGLPTNEVTGLSRSRSGYLFIGTPNGVVRFDGQHFTAIAPTAKTAPHDLGISAFASVPGSDDVLAAPRLGGLLRLSGDDSSDQPLPERFANVPIEALFFENDITLWIGFKGGVAIRRQAGRTEIFDSSTGLDTHHPIQFARDGHGRVWLASGRFLARYDGGQLLGVPAPETTEREPLRIASARKAGPWVIAGEKICKHVDGQLATLTTLSEAAGAYYIQALLEDSAGELWIGTRSRGLFQMSASYAVQHVPAAPDDVSALLEDSSGNLWLGATSGGVARIKPGVLQVFDRRTGLVENRSLALCRDEQDTLWLANRDGGIFHANTAGGLSAFAPTRRWTDFSAFAVSPASGGGVWVSTSHGLLRVERSGLQEHLAHEFLSRWAAPHVALTARNGDLWLALQGGGLCRVRGKDVTRFTRENGLGASQIRTLAEDESGAIWAGADDALLYRSDTAGAFSRVPLPSWADAAGAIQAIHFDSHGTAWIGTQKSGLIRLRDNQAQRIGLEQGLTSENITHLVSDDQDVLWLGSPGAIFHLRIQELERLLDRTLSRVYPVVLGPDEGLQEATCSSEYQPSVWKTAQGSIWFATQQGVVAIDPQRESRAPERLRAKITGVWMDGKRSKTLPVVQVPAGTSSLELQFSAPNLSTPDRVRIRYRLAGVDESWTETLRDNVAKYSRLPPGRYRFEIAGVLAGVPGAESSDSLTLDCEAAWWQTLWFRVLVGLMSLSLVVLVVRRVSHRRLLAKLASVERESALERERTRIAHNIHDDLGAGLTRISLLTQSGRDRAPAQLDRIFDIVGDLIQRMDEIVWAVNPTNDDLESVANYVGEYAQGFLSDAGLRCRIHIPKALPPHRLTAQFRHHLFLTCKEALTNIVRHARATDVSLQIRVRGDTFHVEITDNGIGFNVTAEEASRRHGLKSMRGRMNEIGGEFEISAAPQRGTVIRLAAPLSPTSSL